MTGLTAVVGAATGGGAAADRRKHPFWQASSIGQKPSFSVVGAATGRGMVQ